MADEKTHIACKQADVRSRESRRRHFGAELNRLPV